MALFTPEELAELAAADAELDETFVQSQEEIAASRARDREAAFGEADPQKQKTMERSRSYYQANKERITARQRAYNKANRDKIAAYHRAYYQMHREERNAYQRAYRARKRCEKEERTDAV